jgi:hypothetical protein
MSLACAAALVLFLAQGDQQPTKSEETAPTAEVSTQEEPQPVSAWRARLSTLFEGALMDTENGDDFEETPGYRQLLELVSGYSPEDIKGRARSELDFGGALSDPDAWRGAFVHFRGIVAGIEAVRLREPLLNRTDVYRATVTEADGSEGVMIDLLDHPGELALQRDVVDVEGVFYRTVRYESQSGRMRVAAYLIGRELRRLDPASVPRKTIFDGFAVWIVLLAVAFIVVRVLFSMNRRQPRGVPPGDLAAIREKAARARAEAASKPPPTRNP